MDELALATLEAFLNTHIGHRDLFDPARPDRFDRWVRRGATASGVIDGSPEVRSAIVERLGALAGTQDASAEDIAAARDLRDALIALLLREEAPPDHLDALLERLPVRLRATSEGIALAAGGSGPLAVAAAALVAAHDLAVAGDWTRVRLCRNDDCHWAFHDRSKNRSRVWCSMGSCGGQAKARAYRARQRSA